MPTTNSSVRINKDDLPADIRKALAEAPLLRPLYSSAIEEYIATHEARTVDLRLLNKSANRQVFGENDGFVKWTYPNGDKYEGAMINGQMHGSGTYQWADGRKFTGKWTKGVREGYNDRYKIKRTSTGKFEVVDTIGDWTAARHPTFRDLYDKGDGYVVFHYANGDRYSGAVSSGKRHGLGTYTWSDGARYFGKWHKGLRHGEGNYTSASGDRMAEVWNFGRRIS